MHGGKSVYTALCALNLIACNSGPLPESSPTAHVGDAAFTNTLDTESLNNLRAASCPNEDAFITPQSIPFTATPIVPDALDGAELNGLTFAGAWHLTSEEANFGGLSGLAVHPKDHLLTVSDTGAFVWISMRDHTPSGYAAISYMRDARGQPLQNKRDADSEGLEMIDGLALVSFEHNHRVLAYDLANCGAAAKGVNYAKISATPEGLGKKIPDNRGAESLMHNTSGTLLAGLEVGSADGAPLLEISKGAVRFKSEISRPAGKSLVGLDGLGGTRYALFRAYNPLTGNQIDIHASPDTRDTQPKTLARLKRPFLVDNFEGITATLLPDGTTRLYIISDDNFSARQRTLLMAFDIIEP